MISKGSLVAPLRKLELSQLEHIMTPLTPGDGDRMTPPPTNNGQENNATMITPSNESMGEELGWDVFDANMGTALSPRELLDLAEQLDVESLLHSVDSSLQLRYNKNT